MATATAALSTPEDLANRYDRLAKSTGRTKTFYMPEALAAAIGRLEYEYGLMTYPGSVWLRGMPVWGPDSSGPHRGTAMVATAPPEGLLASETEPPWALAASEAAWRPSP